MKLHKINIFLINFFACATICSADTAEFRIERSIGSTSSVEGEEYMYLGLHTIPSVYEPVQLFRKISDGGLHLGTDQEHPQCTLLKPWVVKFKDPVYAGTLQSGVAPHDLRRRNSGCYGEAVVSFGPEVPRERASLHFGTIGSTGWRGWFFKKKPYLLGLFPGKIIGLSRNPDKE